MRMDVKDDANGREGRCEWTRRTMRMDVKPPWPQRWKRERPASMRKKMNRSNVKPQSELPP